MSAKKSRKGGLKKFGKTGRILSRILSVFLTIMLIGVITGIIVASTFAVYCRDHLFDFDYDIPDLRFSLDMTTTIYYPRYADAERTQLLGYSEMEDQRIYGTENRFWAPVQKMPENLKNAFIAIEDKRFYQHNGIDLKRTIGAALELLKGNKSYGGSTITQQLIKNITDEREGTIQRKVTEISRAISLTKKKSKSEVLEMYLNTIPLSRGNYGVAAAAKYFFDKEVQELTLVECAALAAIPKSPTKYDPTRNPEENKKRRNTVLFEMHNQELISDEEYEAAINEELVLNIPEEEPATAILSYFTDELRRVVQNDLMEQYGYSKEIASQMMLSGGLKIYATIDPEIQAIMEEVYADETTFAKVDGGVQPESAMIVMDPDSGDVLGVIGGRGDKSGNMNLNRATMSKRPIGSSIKPISIYAPAIDLGLINYATVLDDTPYEFNEKMGRYWPRNEPYGYDGRCTLSNAINTSKNTTAVKVLDQLTTDYSYKFLTETLGVKSLVAADKDLSPLALGGLTYGMTVLETAGAYTMLANDGVYSEPRFYTKVVDSNNNVILENPEKHRIAVDRSTSQIMTKLMTGVVEEGTGWRVTLKNKIEVAAKTGTTNNNYDSYFVGYTPYYLGASWFGYDQSRSLAKFGTNQAQVAWDKVMNRVHERVFEEIAEGRANMKTFDYSQLVEAEYCADSGMAPGHLCALDTRGDRTRVGYFKKGTEPRESCDKHVLVEWDAVTGSIASDRCPEENLGQIVLYKVGDERLFDHDIEIADAQYTIMDIPRGYIYPMSQHFTIFRNMAAFDGYVPKSNEEIPKNSYCSVHANEPLQEEPKEDVEDKDNKDEETEKDIIDNVDELPKEDEEAAAKPDDKDSDSEEQEN